MSTKKIPDRDDWHTLADNLTPEGRCLIDGKLVDACDGRTFESINPANGNLITRVARGSSVDIDTAVVSARRTFRAGIWSRLAPRERLNILYRLADMIEAHAQTFALLDTLNMGKPISSMINSDVPNSVCCLRFFAETADKIEGSVGSTQADTLNYILRQPLGVVGAIVPWNYPLQMAMWKVAPALATGNSIVLKPAEQSPLSAILLGQLFLEAGGPPGVLNVVPGLGEEAGKALALHMDVDKIGFTGSVEIGKLMLVYAGQSNMKRVTLECGGKTPQIIMADAENLDHVVNYAVDGIYSNQGEVCNAGSRMLVQASIHDEFIKRFKARASTAYIPGDPLDPATTMGPLVSYEQQKRVQDYIDIGQSEGALLSYQASLQTGLEQGAYVPPTLFTGVNNRMRIAREEIFGPVGAVLSFDTYEEAIQIANDSIFGLAASIWTCDINRALKAARDIEAGVVWVNCFDHGDMTLPWGGYKQSGFGRDKCLETLQHYTQTKGVWVHLGN